LLQAPGVHPGSERLVEAALVGGHRLGEQLIEEGQELREAINSLAGTPGLAPGGGGVEAAPPRPDPEGNRPAEM
jgi:hypothetical protein